MTTKDRYKAHSKLVKEYRVEFEKLVDNLDISELKKIRLDTLFACYAEALKNRFKEHTNLINEKTRQK